MGVYSKILKQAYEITRQYRFLWLFGLILSFVDAMAFILGSLEDHQTKAPANGYLTVGLVLILVLLILLSYRAKTSIIIAIKAITDKQQTSPSKSFRAAKFFYWRVFGATLLMEFATLILIALVYAPVSYLNGQGQMVTSISLGIIGAIILLPVVVAIVLIKVIVPLFIVIYDQKINEAVAKSYGLIAQFWQPILYMEIITFLLQMAILFLTIFMLKLTSGTPLVSYILGAVVYIIFESFVAVFSQTAWVLLFLDLIKPQKLEAEQPVAAPEIAG